MQIIKLPRRGGKTTRALTILKENEKSVVFLHSSFALHEDHIIIKENPRIRKRIFSTNDFRQKLRGMIVDTVIIENADLIDKNLLLEMLYHFTTFPLNLDGLCKIIMTITEEEKMEKEEYTIDFCKKCPTDDHEGYFCRCESRNISVAKMLRERGESPWHKAICDRFQAAVKAFINPGMDEIDYKLCENTINTTITYFNQKRQHKKENEGVL